MTELLLDAAGFACITRLAAFFNALDDGEYKAQLAHVTPDGVWHRRGTPLEGREAIHAAMLERSRDVEVRHMMSNAVATRGQDGPEVTCYVLAFRGERDADQLPALDPPIAMFRFHARFDADSGLITWLRGQPLQRRK